MFSVVKAAVNCSGSHLETIGEHNGANTTVLQTPPKKGCTTKPTATATRT